MTPEEFANFSKEEIVKYGKVVKFAGILSQQMMQLIIHNVWKKVRIALRLSCLVLERFSKLGMLKTGMLKALERRTGN